MTSRVAVLADLGQDVYHAGDEAMGHAAADELRSRGFQVLLLSRNPAQTERLFDAPAAATLPFPWPPAERESYLGHIRAHLAGTSELPPEDPARALIEVLSECDGLLIAGGGNLNSRYGWLLYERAAAVVIARALGKPVVISGQTLGPQLTAPDAIVLAEMLLAADLCSMREPASLQLARSMGVPAAAGLDDASFLTPAASSEPAAASGTAAVNGVQDLPGSGYVAVTVAPLSEGREDLFAQLGAELDSLHGQTGLPVVFVPHMGIGADQGWDMAAHARIAGAMSTRSLQLPVLPARDVAGITAGAAMVLTTRYHPAVFALSAGVPVLGLAPDNYSGVRISGAMGNWGLSDFVLPVPALGEGLLGPALSEAWERRSDISGHLAEVLPSRSAWSQSWWDAVAAVFQQASPASRSAVDLPGTQRFSATGPWLAAAQQSQGKFYGRSGLEAQARVEEDRMRSYMEQERRGYGELQSEHERLLSSRTVKSALSLHRVYTKLFRR